MNYQLDQFRAVLAADGIRKVTAVGVPGGYRLAIENKEGETGILLSRRKERRFAKLDTLAAFLREEGVCRWYVVADQYRPAERALIV